MAVGCLQFLIDLIIFSAKTPCRRWAQKTDFYGDGKLSFPAQEVNLFRIRPFTADEDHLLP